MPTKQELEARIATLEREASEKQRALHLLSLDNGCEVMIPSVGYAAALGDAPYLGKASENLDPWRAKVMPTIINVIKAHGVPMKDKHFWGTSEATKVNLVDQGMSWKDRYLVPKLVGDFIVALLNGAAEFGQDCYAKGYEDGADLLARLTRNEVTVDEFDDSLEREKAIHRQEYKKFSVRTHERKPAEG